MSDTPYNRWQALAMAQLSVAIALISGLSIAGLGAGLSLLQSDKYPFIGWWKCAFLLSQLFLVSASFLSCGAVITRTLDFQREKPARTSSALTIDRFRSSVATRTVMGEPHGDYSGRVVSALRSAQHS